MENNNNCNRDFVSSERSNNVNFNDKNYYHDLKNNTFSNEDQTIKNKKDTYAIASLTLGILTVVFCSIWYIGLIGGILAIVFGAKASSKNRSRMGRAGLILGIIGLTLFIIIYVAVTLFFLSY